MNSEISYIFHSKKGLKRNKNQDKIFILDKNRFSLFCLFDGVSSHENSHLLISKILEFVKKNYKNYFFDENIELDYLFFDANKYALKYKIDGYSTISAIYFSKISKNATYINLGDSRIYNFSNQFLVKITNDNSLKHNSNILTKCLGQEDIEVWDFNLGFVDNKKNFLICSDGFYKLMEKNIKVFFETLNLVYLKNISKNLSNLQKKKNEDDSSFILIKNEI